MDDPLKKTPACELDRDNWVTRPVPGDPFSIWLNLCADPKLTVPMVAGQTFSGVMITETRIYSIGELKRMVEDALVDRQIS